MGLARNNAKKRDKKERTKKKQMAEGETIHPNPGIDARMGEENKNRKQKKEQKKGTGSEPPTQLPGPFGNLLRPTWITWWSFSETPPSPHRGKERIHCWKI